MTEAVAVSSRVPALDPDCATQRLTDSPAIVVGHESASMRRMMSMVESGVTPPLPPQTLEINGTHPIITSLNVAREHPTAPHTRCAPLTRQLCMAVPSSHRGACARLRVWCTGDQSPAMAKKVGEQLLSNALVAAGLMDDPRTMLPNVNALLAELLTPYAPSAAASTAAKSDGAADKE